MVTGAVVLSQPFKSDAVIVYVFATKPVKIPEFNPLAFIAGLITNVNGATPPVGTTVISPSFAPLHEICLPPLNELVTEAGTEITGYGSITIGTVAMKQLFASRTVTV